jgi:hypothetical protein
MQNEIIKNCLMQEYSVGGVAGMGELLAEANGVGREYGEFVTKIIVCCNAVFMGIYSTQYFSPETGAYNQFSINIGQKENKQVYCTDFDFILPFAVRAWLSGEPLQLHFDAYKPRYYASGRDKLDAASLQFKIATKLKKYVEKRFAKNKPDWIVSLQINYALGEIVIPKSE